MSNETVDEKLAALKRMFPGSDDLVLRDLLAMCDGDVKKTQDMIGISTVDNSNEVEEPDEPEDISSVERFPVRPDAFTKLNPRLQSKRLCKSTKKGHQLKILDVFGTKRNEKDTYTPIPDLLLQNSLWEQSLLRKPDTGMNRQATLRTFIRDDGNETNKNDQQFKKIRTLKHGKTLHLYDPLDVALHLPCTLELKIFPVELANRLLKFLMEESQTWSRNEFHMFDRAVSSPHSSIVYTSERGLYESKAFTYNGRQITNVRMFNDDMLEARDIVERAVNAEIKKRGLAKYQYPGKWRTTVAVCNKYDGAKESVGFHSDQLTHLGPHCVIASVSLGVTREFRLKERLYSTAGISTGKEGPGISVHLPHNSLTIMHAGCQENYKHSLIPAAAIDPHPISKNTRINITYRMYLNNFKSESIPTCTCGNPMILRTMANKSRQDVGETKGDGYSYMWMCGNSYNGKEK